MEIIDILLLAIGISFDSFTVSICKGINSNNLKTTSIKCATYFTIFEIIFPILGFLLGKIIFKITNSINHYIFLLLFLVLGIKTIYDGFFNSEKFNNETAKSYLFLAILSNLDSFSIGISFAICNEKIIPLVIFLFPITFISCLIGVFIGKKIGMKNKKLICVISGLILIFIGIKYFIEHL